MNPVSNTIVLVHGLWVTPSSWDRFRQRYEGMGYTVHAPAWPGITGDVSAMRQDPSGLNGIGVGEVMAHYQNLIQGLSERPIIMGHSYGGLITQLLIDRGYGVAGVAIDSVPPKGILPPWSTIEALVPAFLNPATAKRTFLFSFERFWRVFANTLSESEAREAYETQAIPASGRAIFQAALSNFSPAKTVKLNFAKKDRAPLLFIAGEKDVIMPASLNRRNYGRYRIGDSPVEYKVFPGRSHYIIAESGWEEVADYAIDWVLKKTGD